jgi:hypothetical protein
MSSLPDEIISIFQFFSPLFNRKTWVYAQQLAVGAILSPGIRTVASALRVMGLANEARFERYHRVLNRASWSSKQASKILLGLLVALIPNDWPIIIGIDDTLERRKGKRIEAKGSYRDAVRSSDQCMVACYGLKWIAMMLIVPLPWSSRPWALPFLTVLAPSKKCNERKKRRHKTLLEWSRQMMHCVSRWLKKRTWILVTDGGFTCSHLARACANSGVTFISRFRLDARLFDFAPSKTKVGRPSPAGKRLPTLFEICKDVETKWRNETVKWYGGSEKQLAIHSGVCLWYAAKSLPVAIRWVLVKDPNQGDKVETFFSTDIKNDPIKIIEWFILRWNVEVTFQESRRHLGFETQRQWSEKAIARTTPVLLGLYSLVCLFALRMKIHTKQVIETAWYTKNNEATFSDVLAFVKRKIWSNRYFLRSPKRLGLTKLKNADLYFLINQLAAAT